MHILGFTILHVENTHLCMHYLMDNCNRINEYQRNYIFICILSPSETGFIPSSIIRWTTFFLGWNVLQKSRNGLILTLDGSNALLNLSFQGDADISQKTKAGPRAAAPQWRAHMCSFWQPPRSLRHSRLLAAFISAFSSQSLSAQWDEVSF